MLDFYHAALPEGWQILGVRLKPLSLGHLILLHRYESAFVVGGIPTEADLVMSVLICSRTYEDAVDLIDSGQFSKEGRKLDKALKICDDVESRCGWFNDYIKEGLDGPKLWQKEENKGKTLGAPPEQVIKCSLMAKLGLTESQVLNRPFSLSLWDVATLSEMDGNLRIYTDKDAEYQEQVKELERQIEEGEFNPDNIRNN